jgi:hypothetical protein
MTKGIHNVSSGWASWRWLSSMNAKQREWFLGALRGRGGYEAWAAHLARGLQESAFLLQFESEQDPWAISRLVGLKIHELRESFSKMTAEERSELAKQDEVELRSGLELLGRDKRTIEQLIQIVDPPAVA